MCLLFLPENIFGNPNLQEYFSTNIVEKIIRTALKLKTYHIKIESIVY